MTTFDPRIVFISGRICSGKGYTCSQLHLTVPNCGHIIVSDTVRSIVNSNERQVLQNTAYMDKVIAHELARRIDNQFALNRELVIVDGVRQLSIIVELSKSFTNVSYVWVECPAEIRKQRYIARQSSKDSATSFEDAEAADDKLGLADLETWFKTVGTATIINND